MVNGINDVCRRHYLKLNLNLNKCNFYPPVYPPNTQFHRRHYIFDSDKPSFENEIVVDFLKISFLFLSFSAWFWLQPESVVSIRSVRVAHIMCMIYNWSSSSTTRVVLRLDSDFMRISSILRLSCKTLFTANLKSNYLLPYTHTHFHVYAIYIYLHTRIIHILYTHARRNVRPLTSIKKRFFNFIFTSKK